MKKTRKMTAKTRPKIKRITPKRMETKIRKTTKRWKVSPLPAPATIPATATYNIVVKTL